MSFSLLSRLSATPQTRSSLSTRTILKVSCSLQRRRRLCRSSPTKTWPSSWLRFSSSTTRQTGSLPGHSPRQSTRPLCTPSHLKLGTFIIKSLLAIGWYLRNVSRREFQNQWRSEIGQLVRLEDDSSWNTM